MSEDDALSRLFADTPPIADDGFTRRVMALAALEGRLAARRRATLRRLGTEAVALAGVLVAFAALARLGPPSAIVPIGSPAMVGLLLLGSWLALGVRSAADA